MKKLTWLHVLLAFAAFKIIFHFSINGLWSFHRDELLYLALGMHLDWGYASVPPSIGFFGWLGSSGLGGSVEAVRLISTLFGTGIMVLTGLMAKEMLAPTSHEQSLIINQQSGKFAMLLIGLTGLLSGAYLRPSMLFQPVVFDIFYWTLFSWLFLKYLNTEKPKWLLWLGVAFGLGLLNKYSVLLFAFGLLPGLLFTKHRRLFASKYLYLAAGIALLIFLPNLVWQIKNHLPVIRHMSELAESQFANVTIAGFLIDQLTDNLPALPLWLAGLYFLLFKREGKRWRSMAWMYLTVVAALLVLSGKSYYTLGAYPVLIAAGASYFEQLTFAGRRWLRFAIPVFMLAVGLPFLPAVLPVFEPEKEARYFEKMKNVPGLQAPLRWEDGNYYPLPQDFADMLAWDELADLVGKTWQSLPDKSSAAIYAENYGQAGAIEHFGRLQVLSFKDTYWIGYPGVPLPYEIPQVLSFSDAYRYWLPDSLPANFQTLIYVNDELGDDMLSFFADIQEVGRLQTPYAR
ncbi:MAG: glycosyltransferase family 39 protein, partial [Bacteroidota bacterium]